MRIKFLKFLFFLFFSMIVFRLFYWQVIKYDDLSARAEEQHLISREIEGERGSIFFSDGTTLASIRPSYLLYGLPKIIQNKAEVAFNLATAIAKKNITERQKDVIDIETNVIIDLKNKILKQINQNLEWVSIDKDITLKIKKEIESLNFKGISFDSGSARFYPEASIAAHLLGFVG